MDNRFNKIGVAALKFGCAGDEHGTDHPTTSFETPEPRRPAPGQAGVAARQVESVRSIGRLVRLKLLRRAAPGVGGAGQAFQVAP